MLSIGAFAQIGQVTHRMLRHWDTCGLLVPVRVDEFSGYRSYDPAQLARLHRIVALRQLGFGLEDIASVIEEGVDTGRLVELLRLRRAEVEQEHRLAAARLVDVERRLQLIKEENHMSHVDVIEKPLPALRLAARTAVAAELVEVGGLVGPLFAETEAILRPMGVSLATPIAQYASAEEGLRIVTGYAFSGPAPEGIEIVELPLVEHAVVAVHLGSMDRIGVTWQALHEEVIARGLAPSGPCREVYVRSAGEDQTDWVTELQQPVAPA